MKKIIIAVAIVIVGIIAVVCGYLYGMSTLPSADESTRASVNMSETSDYDSGYKSSSPATTSSTETQEIPDIANENAASEKSAPEANPSENNAPAVSTPEPTPTQYPEPANPNAPTYTPSKSEDPRDTALGGKFIVPDGVDARNLTYKDITNS